MGIPFAAPPLNELRWKAPQPIAPWEGIKICVENPATLNRWNRPLEKVDFELEENMSEYWVNFLKTRNPNGTGRPVEWPVFDPQDPMVLELGTNIKVRNIPY